MNKKKEEEMRLVRTLSLFGVLPSRASALAAGYDISSAYDSVVPARSKALIRTDLVVAVPQGTYGRIAPLSGPTEDLLRNRGLMVQVGPSVIDASYRGPLGVLLFNHSDDDYMIRAGTRIAQLVLENVVAPPVLEVEDLEVTLEGHDALAPHSNDID